MSSLPLTKAGVGSAVNDTTQEVGSALGVAVLGSVLSSVYHATVDHSTSLQILPPQVKAEVRDSIGKAAVIASYLGGSPGHVIISAANAAFIDAMHSTVLVGAGVSLCGALVALLFLPSRPDDEQANLTEESDVATIDVQKET